MAYQGSEVKIKLLQNDINLPPFQIFFNDQQSRNTSVSSLTLCKGFPQILRTPKTVWKHWIFHLLMDINEVKPQTLAPKKTDPFPSSLNFNPRCSGRHGKERARYLVYKILPIAYSNKTGLLWKLWEKFYFLEMR